MKNGPYELVVVPKDYPGFKYRGRYAYEHHVVWWQNTGILIQKGQNVHHKNNNQRDNRFNNLILMDGSKHREIHGSEQKKKWKKYQCGYCCQVKQAPPGELRARRKRNQSKLLFCSSSCGVKFQMKTVKSKKVSFKCPTCLIFKSIKKSLRVQRLNRNKSKKTFCSKSCSTKYIRNLL